MLCKSFLTTYCVSKNSWNSELYDLPAKERGSMGSQWFSANFDLYQQGTIPYHRYAHQVQTCGGQPTNPGNRKHFGLTSPISFAEK